MTRPRTTSIAVVGVGVMGKNHLKTIAKIENLALTAVCDVNPTVKSDHGKRFAMYVEYGKRMETIIRQAGGVLD